MLSYLSILLGEVFNFCPALLPGLFIPLVPQLPWNLFKNGPVPAHAIQLVLDVLLAPYTDKSPCSVRAPTSSCHFAVIMRAGSTVERQELPRARAAYADHAYHNNIARIAIRGFSSARSTLNRIQTTYGSELRLNRFRTGSAECALSVDGSNAH